MLGYRSNNIPGLFAEELNRGLSECDSFNDGGWVIKLFDDFNITGDSICIMNSCLDVGERVTDNIRQATCLAVITCTAGSRLGSLIEKFTHQGDLLKAYLYDILGTEIIYGITENIYKVLKDKYATGMSDLFSPGSCGWNIKDQVHIFELLSDINNKVRLNKSCLMVPVKSLSGIIGMGEGMQRSQYPCDRCEIKKCDFRNIYRADA